jgi:hypothetical protein
MFCPLPSLGLDEEIEIEQDGITISAVVPFAVCLDTNRIASVRCILEYLLDVELNIEYPGICEFSFDISIITIDDTQEPLFTQDRNIVKNYLDEICRLTIMPKVLDIIDKLIDKDKPLFIYRVTKSRVINDELLVKHNLITDKLQSLGYSVFQCDYDKLGRAFWIMGLEPSDEN